MTPKVYVLLPVHNRRATTEVFIRCLLAQTYDNWHLVLIDDGSKDGTGAMARELAPSLTILRGRGNWWWGGSLQQGYGWLKQHKPAPDDIVLIANDDTVFKADFLANAVTAVKPRALLLAQLYSMEGNFEEIGVHCDWRAFSWVSAATEADLNCFSTRGLFLHAGDFMEIGGFHPVLLPHYLSDYEFTMRALRKGFALVTDPRVFLQYDASLTGIRSVEGNSILRSLRLNLSVRSSSNPFYWTSFVLLACPAPFIPINILRVWWGFLQPVHSRVQRRLAPVRQRLAPVKRKVKRLLNMMLGRPRTPKGPKPEYHFCTLFDRNYASRGLSLYHSLERVCAKDFRLTILCMDSEIHDALSRLKLPRAHLIRVEDLGDAELLEVRKTRALREFCWTCPGPLMLALMKDVSGGEVVTYLDADLAFFNDPQPVYDELGDKDIFIHGHRFAPNYEIYAASSGIFNVGLIAVRKAPEGIACLERWRAQCLDVCELDPERGFCGDQKYLDEWPSRYTNLVVAEHPGVALAPWNIENHTVTKKWGRVLVDGKPLIFYHYHALRILAAPKWLTWVVLSAAGGYEFSAGQIRILYRPYVRMLRNAQRQLADVALDGPRPAMSRREIRNQFPPKKLVFG